MRKAEQLNKIHIQQIELLRQHYGKATAGPAQRLALPHASGLAFITIHQILYCEADSNYSRFYLENGEQYLVCKTSARL